MVPAHLSQSASSAVAGRSTSAALATSAGAIPGRLQASMKLSAWSSMLCLPWLSTDRNGARYSRSANQGCAEYSCSMCATGLSMRSTCWMVWPSNSILKTHGGS